MTVPSISIMLDITQIALTELFSNNNNKIAVHCHAGFGRTGLTIACILIAFFGMNGQEAIDLVREKRYCY